MEESKKDEPQPSENSSVQELNKSSEPDDTYGSTQPLVKENDDTKNDMETKPVDGPDNATKVCPPTSAQPTEGAGEGDGDLSGDRLSVSLTPSPLVNRLDDGQPPPRRHRTRCCAGCCPGPPPPDGGRVLSIMYCVIIMLLATILPVSEGLQYTWFTDITIAVFIAYLYGASIIYVVFLEIYLLRQAKLRRARRRGPQGDVRTADDILMNGGNAEGVGKMNAGFRGSEQSVTLDSKVLPNVDEELDTKSETSNVTELFMGDTDESLDVPMPHRTTIFLKIGVAVFALGMMIYDGLLLKQLHERHSPSACSTKSMIWPYYMHLVFLIVQTFFVFKHSQVVLMSWQPLMRVGFLHMFATNWSVWVQALVRETLDDVIKHRLDNVHVMNATETKMFLDTYQTCYVDDDILYRASPYLYPCILQYSILAMAAMYSLYADVGAYGIRDEPKKADDIMDSTDSVRRGTLKKGEINAINFHKTHRGLFIGLIIIAGTFVSIILFFSYLANKDDSGQTPLLIYYITDIGVHSILILVVAIAWLHSRRLSFSLQNESFVVDEVLLMVAMIGSLFYRLFKAIVIYQALLDGVTHTNAILSFCDILLGIAVNVLQTSFILEGFRRRSTTKAHLKMKPGRGSITFLLVTNLAAWAFRMLQLKQIQVETIEKEQTLYGFLSWQLLLHIFVPLLIFYHFQASASLARIWTNAYRKETVKESLRRQAEELEEARRKIRVVETPEPDIPFYYPSPIMRVIELRRRFRKRDAHDTEPATVWSPVSDV